MSISLLEIKSYMMQVRITSLANLCTIFNADAERLRCMLGHWMQKGKIRKCLKEPACDSKCFKCPTTSTEIYEWIDNGTSLDQRIFQTLTS